MKSKFQMKPAKVGRPTDYDPEFCQVAIEFLDEGKSRIQLCRLLRISKSTMWEWEQKYPEFSNAIEHGITYSEAVWHDKGEEHLCNKDFQTRLYELNMMNRFGWKRKHEEKSNITAEIKEIDKKAEENKEKYGRDY